MSLIYSILVDSLTVKWVIYSEVDRKFEKVIVFLRTRDITKLAVYNAHTVVMPRILTIPKVSEVVYERPECRKTVNSKTKEPHPKFVSYFTDDNIV